MMSLTQLGRYVTIKTMAGWAVLTLIMLTLVLLVDTVEQLNVFGDRAGITALEALQLTLMRVPMIVQSASPFIFLFGTLLAFERMNRTNELVVLRASGVSAWSFLAGPALMAVIVGFGAFTAFNPAASYLNGVYEARKAELLPTEDTSIMRSTSGVWLRQRARDGEILIHASEVNGLDEPFRRVTALLYELKPDTGELNLVRRIDAEEARIRGGFIELADGVETQFAGGATPFEALSLPTTIDPRVLFRDYAEPSAVSFWRLPGAYASTVASGFDALPYAVEFWKLTATPLAFAAMTILAGALSIQFNRGGGLIWMIITAAAIGVVMYFLGSFLATLARNGSLPPWLAAYAPPLAAMFAGCSVVAWREDG